MVDDVANEESIRVVALVATIPARRQSCERLLRELTKQSRVPDGVVLVLDGYGEAPAPACELPVISEHRTSELSGAGNRWRATEELRPEDIVVCLDDDVMLIQAPKIVESLVKEVEAGGAAAAMGFSVDGRRAPPGAYGRGTLIYGAGCGFALRAKHLTGLERFATDVRAAGGPDALGLGGDDDALLSAYLWKTGVAIRHAATGNIYAAPGTRTTSQTAARAANREQPDAQKLAIQRITGWPWRLPGVTSGLRA